MHVTLSGKFGWDVVDAIFRLGEERRIFEVLEGLESIEVVLRAPDKGFHSIRNEPLLHRTLLIPLSKLTRIFLFIEPLNTIHRLKRQPIHQKHFCSDLLYALFFDRLDRRTSLPVRKF